jgi:hypothetical protein
MTLFEDDGPQGTQALLAATILGVILKHKRLRQFR